MLQMPQMPDSPSPLQPDGASGSDSSLWASIWNPHTANYDGRDLDDVGVTLVIQLVRKQRLFAWDGFQENVKCFHIFINQGVEMATSKSIIHRKSINKRSSK